MTKEGFPWNTVILIGALAVGVYFLYSYLKNSPVGKAVGGITEGVSTITNTTEKITEQILQPIIQPTVTKEIGIKTPSPLEYSMPVLALPKFIESFVTDKTGKVNPFVAPLKATLAVGLTTGALKPISKPVAKTSIPIVAKSTSGAINVLKPLEIVKTGQAIHKVNLIAKNEGAYKTIGITQPISPSKTVTVTKTLGVPTKVTISKIMRS